MQLYVWRGKVRNFGDELNRLLWPLLLPGLFDGDPGTLFLGIGSVLDARHGAVRRKVVAGAGYGGYEAPAALDGSWEIYWVRGPHTARQLGLPAAFGVGDPASLVPLVLRPAASAAAGGIGFLPHFESLAHGAWPAACAAAGVALIDPRGDPAEVLVRIAGCRLLLSEALHGAVVADALRVPWIALRPIAPRHRAKWLDWAGALGLTPRFQPLAVSAPRERLAAWQPVRRPPRALLAVAAWCAHRLPPGICVERAASALRCAAAAAPQLSTGTTLARAQDRMLTRLVTLRRDLGADVRAAA